ncbi:unnamed protein product [Calypogeia fissa]
MRVAGANVLVVPPFECAWLMGEEARFAEPGKACVAFEAMTENDVTVVFKELAGSKHYRTDPDPSYTLILGSHCNRRLKIEVDGQPVVDVANVMLEPTHFEHYWINVSDGVLTVGKGDPGKGVLCQWVDSKPNCTIQYVGLSSWDKHVVYRNIQVLPPLQPPGIQIPLDNGGFSQYLESEELADLRLIVAPDKRIVPAHKILLALCCSKFLDMCVSPAGAIHMPHVDYNILHAFLQYVYTGHTQVDENQLYDLKRLAEEFGLELLVSQCHDELTNSIGRDSEDVTESCGESRKLDIELKNILGKPDLEGSFLSQLPIDQVKLSNLFDSGDYADVELSVEGQKEVVRAHRLILSAWSRPFAKMFTNGMRESKMDTVSIQDVGFEPLLVMVNFMYKGHLQVHGLENMGSVLLPLLISADQFGMHLLQKKCIDYLLGCLTKDCACAVLHVAASLPFCQSLCEICEELVANHFDFCTALPSLQFYELQTSSLIKILQHPSLRVTSEEKVLDAVISWAAKKDGIGSWKDANTYHLCKMDESLFSDRLMDLEILLPNVRFPLISLAVLQELQASCLTRSIRVLQELVEEAREYLGHGSDMVASHSNVLPTVDSQHGRLVRFPRSTLRFTPRPSTYKELQYICDGDRNGVFYHIGTLYGRHSWMNPVLTKKLFVSASSPPSRFTDMKAIVSRKYQNTSFAGPCSTEGRISSWWKADLGQNHHLMCNYYTVRQDGSTDFMRSWSLQGSNDDENWTEICCRENDQTLCRAGQYASWPVHGTTATLPFRYFRIVLNQPTTSIVNPWNLCLCYLELYGFFH